MMKLLCGIIIVKMLQKAFRNHVNNDSIKKLEITDPRTGRSITWTVGEGVVINQKEG